MVQLGYTRDDIEMYLSEITKEVSTEKVKYLPQKTYERWYSTRIIDEQRFRKVMIDLDRRPEDIKNLVREFRPKAAETEV